MSAVRSQNLLIQLTQRLTVKIQQQMRMIMKVTYFLLVLKPKQLNEEDLLKNKINSSTKRKFLNLVKLTRSSLLPVKKVISIENKK